MWRFNLQYQRSRQVVVCKSKYIARVSNIDSHTHRKKRPFTLKFTTYFNSSLWFMEFRPKWLRFSVFFFIVRSMQNVIFRCTTREKEIKFSVSFVCCRHNGCKISGKTNNSTWRERLCKDWINYCFGTVLHSFEICENCVLTPWLSFALCRPSDKSIGSDFFRTF